MTSLTSIIVQGSTSEALDNTTDPSETMAFRFLMESHDVMEKFLGEPTKTQHNWKQLQSARDPSDDRRRENSREIDSSR